MISAHGVHAAPLENPIQARDAVNTSHQGKENMPSVVTKDAPAPSPAGIRDHLNCRLCSQLVAAPLVVSCGHMFCGQCLFEHLTKDPMCPTCSMGLRSIPVRCLPVDAVVEALKTHMPAKDRERFNKRVEEGRSAADKVNKIFWWLAPQAVPIAGAQLGQVGLSFANPASSQLPVQPLASLPQAQAQAQQQQQRGKQQHKQPKRHASMPQIPKASYPPPQQQHNHQHHHLQQPLLPAQQALFGGAGLGGLGLGLPQVAAHMAQLLPEPAAPQMMFSERQLASIMQRLYT